MSDYYPVKVFGLDCCWVCHEELKVPLQACQMRHLAMRRIHQACFNPALFEQYGSEIIVLVGERSIEERVPLTWQQQQRKSQQLDPFED